MCLKVLLRDCQLVETLGVARQGDRAIGAGDSAEGRVAGVGQRHEADACVGHRGVVSAVAHRHLDLRFDLRLAQLGERDAGLKDGAGATHLGVEAESHLAGPVVVLGGFDDDLGVEHDGGLDQGEPSAVGQPLYGMADAATLEADLDACQLLVVLIDDLDPDRNSRLGVARHGPGQHHDGARQAGQVVTELDAELRREQALGLVGFIRGFDEQPGAEPLLARVAPGAHPQGGPAVGVGGGAVVGGSGVDPALMRDRDRDTRDKTSMLVDDGDDEQGLAPLSQSELDADALAATPGPSSRVSLPVV